MKKVIDMDYMVCLETFDEKDTQMILEKYQSLGKWDDIQVDYEGHIFLYENE